MGQMDVAQGHLFGTIFEAILYGIYLVLYIACLYIFRRRNRRNTRTNRIVMAAISLMFAVATAHMAGQIAYLQEGFFAARQETPEAYFNDKSAILNTVTNSLYGVSMLIGDSLMIYRLHVIYPSNRWVIIPPLMTLLGSTVSWILMVWEFSQLAPGQSAFVTSCKKLASATFSLSLITNVMITGLIVYRIWQSERRLKNAFQDADVSYYRAFIANTIESCVVYPVVLVVTLVLYGLNNNGQDILTRGMTQVICIVPTLLWMQVRLGFSRYDAAASAETSGTLAHPVNTPITLVSRERKRKTDISSDTASSTVNI